VPEERAWEVAEGDEYDVRVYGDTALIIGRWTARGVNHGVHFDYQARFRRPEQVIQVDEREGELLAQPSREVALPLCTYTGHFLHRAYGGTSFPRPA
jgi:hypothetical protein